MLVSAIDTNSSPIQELDSVELDAVGGGIPLVVAGYMAFYGAKTAYAAGVAAGAGVTLYSLFD
jgi:hypothetical protein